MMAVTAIIPNSRGLAVSLCIFLILSVAYFLYDDPGFARAPTAVVPGHVSPPADASMTKQSLAGRRMTDDIAQYFIDYPLKPPYKGIFGELGRRARILRDWLVYAEAQGTPNTQDVVLLEQVAATLFPFLKNQPRFPTSIRPLFDLRSSFEPGSAGIVIPAGDSTIRYAAHLILSIRSALSSTLPIQIVYAGDVDLSLANRELLVKMTEGYSPRTIEFLDITTIFDGPLLNFTNSKKSGGWATKPFAALGSRFEKVIVLDADAVFLQPPEVLLNHTSFQRSGALLFHDRLLWQHRFQDRHEWWRDQIRRPSPTLEKSLVWKEDYAEECDSGVVVLDKSRVDVLMGLLHTCWQNSYEVREQITYSITYGDKETWWMGLEMAGSGYEMAQHYGGIVGWEQKGEKGTSDKVCSFVIAHVDASDRLLWYNGGLLKNKLTSATEYEVPSHWQIDGTWEKGGAKESASCMVSGTVRTLNGKELLVLEQSIDKAKWIDGQFGVH